MTINPNAKLVAHLTNTLHEVMLVFHKSQSIDHSHLRKMKQYHLAYLWLLNWQSKAKAEKAYAEAKSEAKAKATAAEAAIRAALRAKAELGYAIKAAKANTEATAAKAEAKVSREPNKDQYSVSSFIKSQR